MSVVDIPTEDRVTVQVKVTLVDPVLAPGEPSIPTGSTEMRWWTPVLGPSSVALLQHLVQVGARALTVTDVGLGQAVGLNRPRLDHTWRRLARFEIVWVRDCVDHRAVVVPTAVGLPSLSQRARCYPPHVARMFTDRFPEVLP